MESTEKNILVLNYEFPPLWGWWSPICYEISKNYVKNWYNVDVVTMWYSWLPRFEVIEWMNIYRVKCLRSKKQVCHPWEQLSYIISGYFQVKKLVKQKKYSISHTHFIIPTWVLARIVKKKFGIPYIITAHGSDVLWHNPRFDKLYPYLKGIWTKVIDDSKNIVSPSAYLKEKIDFIYWEDPKVVIIPNGIEKGKFVPLQKEKYILTVSRLVHAKWIQDLIEAVKDIKLWDWKIKIVWEWPLKSELEQKVLDYGLGNNIEFLWWVDNASEHMKDLYGKASIFCQPSHFENMSVVLLEAMQAGCVIVANNVWWNKEVVWDNWVYTAHSKIELQESLSNLFQDKNLREELSQKNLQLSRKFEWDMIHPEYMQLLSYD